MKDRICALVAAASEKLGAIHASLISSIEISETREKAHGDYATNIAMLLAGKLRCAPRQVAEAIIANIDDKDEVLAKVEIAGPGFINFFLKKDVWGFCLRDVLDSGASYGRHNFGVGQKAQVEFVSANPTGPLHIGHARGAIVGDAIARFLSACGYEVVREYYINDKGNQMDNLGLSTLYRCRELRGEKLKLPTNCYQGKYLLEVARDALNAHPEILSLEESEAVALCTKFAADAIMRGIIDDLSAFGIHFDIYFSEKDLYEQGLVDFALAALEKAGTVYRGDDGTLWFKTTAFGDDKDRVVVRTNGEPTYFAADIAYHHQKFARGFDKLIDIWGADHHGYTARVRAGVRAMGNDPDRLDIILIQLVALLRDGTPVAMSTRAGEFITMREVIDEVGADAARYNFLLRRSDSPLDFDLEVAKRQSNDNPVYYVQYAHARMCSILRMAQEKKIPLPIWDEGLAKRLVAEEEVEIIKALVGFPETVRLAAHNLEPHRVAFFLNELAGMFHSYYNKHKVISDDGEITSARLLLITAIKAALKNGLTILGVSAPEKM